MSRSTVLRRAGATATLLAGVAAAWSTGSAAADPVASIDGPDLAVTLEGAPAEATPGTDVRLVVGVSNAGPVDATSATLVVGLPSGSSLRSASAKHGSCAPQASSVVCDLGSIAAGSSIGVELVVRTNPFAAGGTLSTVRATGVAAGDVDVDDNVAELVLAAGVPRSTVSVSGPLPVRLTAGDPSEVTWMVHNDGPSAAREVAVAVGVPAGITVEGQECTVTLVGLRCAVGDLGPGEERPLHLSLTASAALRGRTVAAPPPDGAATALAIVAEVVAPPRPTARPGGDPAPGPAMPTSGVADADTGPFADDGAEDATASLDDELPEALAFTGDRTSGLLAAGIGLLAAAGATVAVRRRGAGAVTVGSGTAPQG